MCNELGKIHVRLVIGLVRDDANRSKGQAKIVADLCHRGPFHFNGQDMGEGAQYPVALGILPNELVATGHEPMVNNPVFVRDAQLLEQTRLV